MGIQVGDNFDHKSKKPLDNRTAYATLAAMKAVVDATINEGCLAYCAETDKYYKFLSTNTVDESTGKWREFQTGSGGGAEIDDSTTSASKTWSSDKISTELAKKSEFSGSYNDLTNKPTIPSVGGHTIKNSAGTSMTQHDNLQFDAPFTVTDDSTNGKTKIGQNTLSSSDLDDFDEPSQASTGVTNISQMNDVTVSSAIGGQQLTWNGSKWVNKFHTYSTTEQVVGKWIGGKTIYEKVITTTAPTCSTGGTFVSEDVSVGATVNEFLPNCCAMINIDGANCVLPKLASHTNPVQYLEVIFRDNSFSDSSKKNKITVSNSRPGYNGKTITIILQYTKV